MSDLDALAQKISALVAGDQVFDAGARVISEGGDPAPLNAILAAIDDTILERRLAFAIDTSTVHLVAAGRRLRGIVSVAPKTPTADLVLGKTLSREEPDVVQATHDLLRTVCGEAKRVTVKNLPTEPFGKGGERGISASGLTELWQVEEDTAPKVPMTQFLTKNANAMSATMHVNDGNIVGISGDFETLQTIWNTQVLDFRKAHKRHLDGSDGPQLICLEGALKDGAAAALAVEGDDVALFAYHPDQLETMLDSWRAITG